MADVALTQAASTGRWTRYTATLTDVNNTTIPFPIGRASRVVFSQAADQTGAGAAFSALAPLLVASDGTVLDDWGSDAATAGVIRNAVPAATVAASTPGYVDCRICGGLFLKLEGTGAGATKSMAIEIVVFY